MNIVLQKQLNSIPATIDGEIKFPVTYHEQRIPSFEVSLLSPSSSDDVAGPPTVQVIQSAAVVSVIATQGQTPVGFLPSAKADNCLPTNSSSLAFDRSEALVVMSSPQSPGVVPSHNCSTRHSQLSSPRAEQREVNTFCGVIYQDHNYGAPLPFSPANSCPQQSCSYIENDDLPAKLVPLTIAQTIKTPSNPSVSSISAQRSDRVDESTVNHASVERVAPVKMTKKQKEMASHSACCHYDNVGNAVKPKTSGTRCICDFLHDDGYMIQCDCCTAWQHVACVGLSRGNYFCEVCNPREVNRPRAIAIQERKIKRGAVKAAQKKEVVKKEKIQDRKSVENMEKKKTHRAIPTKSTFPIVALNSAGDSPIHSNNELSAISREERKLLAIMRQFEEMEKKSRDKDLAATTTDEHSGVRKEKDVNESCRRAVQFNANKAPETDKAAHRGEKHCIKKAVQKSQPRGNSSPGRRLVSVLKKRNRKVVKKMQTKLRSRKGAKSRKQFKEPSLPSMSSSTTSTSSILSQSEKVGHFRKGRDEVSESFTSADAANIPMQTLPGTGKKRWLNQSDSISVQAAAMTDTAFLSGEDSRPTTFVQQTKIDNCANDLDSQVISNVSQSIFFESKIVDTLPSTVTSPPGSPEPVLAPLKKRYARTESTSTPLLESVPIVSTAAVSGQANVVTPCQYEVPELNCFPSSAVLPPLVESLSLENNTSTVLLTKADLPVAVSLHNDVFVKSEVEQQISPPRSSHSEICLDGVASCPAVEQPAKRKVSLKEYKQRFREQPEASSSTASKNPRVEAPTCDFSRADCETSNTNGCAVYNEVAVLPVNATCSERLPDNSVMLDVDNDDILVTPLPCDIHIHGFKGDLTLDTPEHVRSDSASKYHVRSHSRRRQHRQPNPGSDLRIVIPSKAERVAKLKRVDRWLDDVIKKSDDVVEHEPTAEESGDVSIYAIHTVNFNERSAASDCCSPDKLVTQNGREIEISERMAHPVLSSSGVAVSNIIVATTTTTISTTASVDDISNSSVPLHSPQYNNNTK